MYSHHSRQYLTRSVLQPRVVYLPFESLKNYRWKYARREHLHNIFTSFVYKNSTDSISNLIFHYSKYPTFSTLGSLLKDKNLRKINFNGEFEFFLRYFLSLSFNFSHPKLKSNLFSTRKTIYISPSSPQLCGYPDWKGSRSRCCRGISKYRLGKFLSERWTTLFNTRGRRE